jgi:hypothetical protein
MRRRGLLFGVSRFSSLNNSSSSCAVCRWRKLQCVRAALCHRIIARRADRYNCPR